MRISCLQENLSKGLSIAGRVTSTRSSLPVLDNILFEAGNGQVRLVCTNLDVSINVWINASVEEEGAVTVPVRLLTDFVAFLPANQKVDLAYEEKNRQVTVKCGSYSASFNTIDASEFPQIPDALQPDLAVHQLNAQGLRSMIDQTVFAAATGDERPNLAGVEMHFMNGRLTMAATDGFRLSVRSANLDLQSETEIKILVPARALAELARILPEATSIQPIQMVVTSNSNQILFEVVGLPSERGSFVKVLLMCQLIDAQFPDYNRIIPTEHAARVVTSTEELLQAARASFLFTKENNSIISAQVSCEDNCISVSSQSVERGGSVNAIKAAVEGDSLRISFNGQYLIDVLSHLHTEEVMMEMTQPGRPCKVKPVGKQDEDEFLHIIMPMSQPRQPQR